MESKSQELLIFTALKMYFRQQSCSEFSRHLLQKARQYIFQTPWETLLSVTTTQHCLCRIKHSYVTFQPMGMAVFPLNFIHSNRQWARFD